MPPPGQCFKLSEEWSSGEWGIVIPLTFIPLTTKSSCFGAVANWSGVRSPKPKVERLGL